MIRRLTQLVLSLPILLIFASFFFPQFFPWSSRDFTIPTDGVAELEEDRYGVWRTETRVLLRDTTSFWKRALAKEGVDYTEPALSFFFGETKDACGTGIASEVALYCPNTEEIVVDTAEYQSASRQVGLRNHIAVAYSFAHQVGHHVQHLRGIPEPRTGEDPASHARRVELQADCYAGIWLRTTQGRYGEFDFHDVYQIQKQFFPRHDPKSLQQIPGAMMETRDYADNQERTDWVRVGYKSGKLTDCDTFSQEAL